MSLLQPFLAWNNSNNVLVLCLAHFWHSEVQFHNMLVLTMDPSTIPFYYEAMQCGANVLYLGFPHQASSDTIRVYFDSFLFIWIENYPDVAQ